MAEMSSIDISKLLTEVTADYPCGGDLEYDPAFIAVEQLAQGKPEQQIGATVVAAQEPDWHELEQESLELFKRTKDIRLAVYLTQALVRNKGLTGLQDGLLLIKSLLEEFWDELHPQLDASDNNDPTLRVNSIAAICDAETMLKGVRESILAKSNVFGRFSLRDIQYSSGKLSPPDGEEVVEMSTINAAFMDSNVEDLQLLESALMLSLDALAGIESLLVEKVGVEQSPDLSPLNDLLKETRHVLNEQLAQRGVAQEGNEDAVNDAMDVNRETTESDTFEEAPIEKSARATPAIKRIDSREDVVRSLDLLCEYYARCEPSSPVPLLLQRAKRLVAKDFMEIMRDLAPAGLAQVEEVGGASTEDVK